MGQTLANHSYVDLSLVGNVNISSVQYRRVVVNLEIGNFLVKLAMELDCHSKELVIFIHLFRTTQRVNLRRTVATSPSGIYRCHIPTVAVHDDQSRKQSMLEFMALEVR